MKSTLSDERFGPADCSHRKRIKQCWDARRAWWRRTPHSTPQEMRRQRNTRASNASAFQSLDQKPRAQARAEEALVPQRPEMADRMRGTHQRGQAADTGSTRCRYKGDAGMERWSGSAWSPTTSSTSAAQWKSNPSRRPCVQPKLPPIRRPPTAGFSFRRVIDHSPANVNFCAGK